MKFIAICLTSILFSFKAYSANNAGVFMIVKGKVEVVSANGSKKKARMGMKVFAKDTIIAQKKSRAKVVMIDKNVLNISPDSKIQLQDYKYNPQKNEKNVMINLIYGKIRSKVKQKYDEKKNTFRVKTKAAVAGVRGTDFIVGFEGNKTQVTTFEGRVEVGASIANTGVISNPVRVDPGQMTTVKVNTPPKPPIEVPKAELASMDKESNADTAGDVREPAGNQAPLPPKESEEDKKDPDQAENPSNDPLKTEEANAETPDNGPEGEREPAANTMLPPPPPPVGEGMVIDEGMGADLAGGYLPPPLPDTETGYQPNPIIDDIIQQTNTRVNLIIVGP